MADNQAVDTKLGLDITEWKTGVAEINRSVRVLESDFKAVAAGMDDWKTSADGLALRNDTLTQQIDKQKQKVALLEAEYQRMKDAAEANGDTSDKTRASLEQFQIKLNSAREQLAKNETELRKNSNALDDMNSAIPGLNKEISVLESEVEAATSGMDNWKNSVEGLTIRNEKLSEIAEKQKRIVGELENKYKTMKETAEANNDTSEDTKNQLMDLEIEINKSKTTLGKYESEIRKNSNALVELEAKEQAAEDSTDALGKEANKAAKEHVSLGDAMRSAGEAARSVLTAGLQMAMGAITAVGSAIGVAATQAYDFAKSAGKMADDVATLSAQTGVSTSELQKWSYTSNFIDTPVETMTKSMAKMVKGMGDADKGSKSAQENFKALGLNIYDSSGKLKDSESLFAEAIDSLGKISNEAERDAKAMALFGKSAQELNPLIQAGGEAFRQIGEEAERMGVVFSEEQIAKMGAFDDAMQKFNATGEGLKNTIGMTVMPLFQPLVEMATTSMASISNALKDGLQPGELDEIFTTISTSLTDTIQSVTGIIGDMLPVVIEGFNILVPQIVAFLPTLADTLIPAAADLLQALLDAITDNLDPILNVVTQLLTAMGTFMIENLPMLIDAGAQIILMLAQYMADNAAQMADGLKQVMTAIIDGIIALLPDLIPLGVKLMVELGAALIQAIPELAAKLPEIVAAIVEGITKIDWIQVGSDLLNGLVNGIRSAIQSVGKAIGDAFKAVIDIIKGIFGIASPSKEMASIGGFLLDGLINGLWAGIEAVLNAVKEIFGKIWEVIKSIFGFGGGESEESKEAKNAGQDIMKGMEQGIKDNEKTLKDVVVDVSKNVLKAFRSEFGIPDPQGASDKTRAFGRNLAEGIRDGMSEESKPGTFGGASNDMMNAIGTALRSAFGIGGTGILGLGAASASKFKDIGKAIAQGVAQGIGEGANQIKSAATKAANDALSAAKRELGIKSPSRKAYDEIGVPFIQGISNAIKDSQTGLQKDVSASMGLLSRNAVPALQESIQSARTIVPVTAELVLDGHSFGKLVVELSDSGSGKAFSDFQRLQTGVVIA